MTIQARIKKFTASKPFLLICITLVILLITYLIKPGSFNMGNARQLLSNISYTGVFLCGVACLLISGGIDFSTSGQATISMLLFAQLTIVAPGLPWPVAILAALACGAATGAINAFFVSGLNLIPFIATIGMQSVFSGLASWYTRGQIISIRAQGFNKLSALYLGSSPIPVLFVVTVLIVLGYSFVLKRTTFGRSVMMVGGNPLAARLAGLNPKKIKSILFINNGILSAVGGLIWASQMKMGSPAGLITLAPEMTALSASILGGVSFMGGAGALGGAFFGIVLIQVLAYALQVIGAPLWVITLLNGSILVVALTLDNYTTQRRLRKLGLAGAGGGGGGGMPGMSR